MKSVYLSTLKTKDQLTSLWSVIDFGPICRLGASPSVPFQLDVWLIIPKKVSFNYFNKKTVLVFKLKHVDRKLMILDLTLRMRTTLPETSSK